jgi:hypothetical protein
MIGLESLGMSLEDVFISVVNKSDELPIVREKAARTAKRNQGKMQKGAAEEQLAESLVKSAERKREEDAKNFDYDSAFDD